MPTTTLEKPNISFGILGLETEFDTEKLPGLEPFECIGANESELIDAAIIFNNACQREPAVWRFQKEMEQVDEGVTLEHSRNVALLAVIIGRRLDLHPDDIDLLAVAGMCHDVGKLDPEILSAVKSRENFDPKPGETNEERMKREARREEFFKVMSLHPKRSQKKILSLVGKDKNQRLWSSPEFQEDVGVIAAGHHWYQAKGYGEEPPTEGLKVLTKLLRLADKIEAMATKKRGYKSAFSRDQIEDKLSTDVGADEGESLAACFNHESSGLELSRSPWVKAILQSYERKQR